MPDGIPAKSRGWRLPTVAPADLAPMAPDPTQAAPDDGPCVPGPDDDLLRGAVALLPAGAAAPAPADVVLIDAASIHPEPVAWLWPGWLARGKVHILAGAPGTGKTTLALSLAATLTAAGRWPDGAGAPLADVVIWSGEDDPRDTLIPRLLAAGADLSRVRLVGSHTGGERVRPFDPATDLPDLADALAHSPPALLIVDPVVSAVSGDSHKNAEVRRALQPLVDLAQLRRCAVVGITHLTKGTAGRDPTERVTGSLAFGALARVVMMAAKLPDGRGRALMRAKSNLGTDAGGFGYDLEACQLDGYPDVHSVRLLWGGAIEGSARDVMTDADGREGDEGDALEDTVTFLRDLLADGPVTVKQIKADASGAGYAWRTI